MTGNGTRLARSRFGTARGKVTLEKPRLRRPQGQQIDKNRSMNAANTKNQKLISLYSYVKQLKFLNVFTLRRLTETCPENSPRSRPLVL